MACLVEDPQRELAAIHAAEGEQADYERREQPGERLAGVGDARGAGPDDRRDDGEDEEERVGRDRGDRPAAAVEQPSATWAGTRGGGATRLLRCTAGFGGTRLRPLRRVFFRGREDQILTPGIAL